ncbi:hypothetical protein BDF14DRAFT_1857154 [Spinellus fusiger]|nr:hypothetical protein BDF14DRAFT_1857154 [Spinellus fusiger]
MGNILVLSLFISSHSGTCYCSTHPPPSSTHCSHSLPWLVDSSKGIFLDLCHPCQLNINTDLPDIVSLARVRTTLSKHIHQ